MSGAGSFRRDTLIIHGSCPARVPSAPGSRSFGGRNSVWLECDCATVEVMGSNPFARTSPPWRNWQRSRFVNGRFRVQLPRAAPVCGCGQVAKAAAFQVAIRRFESYHPPLRWCWADCLRAAWRSPKPPVLVRVRVGPPVGFCFGAKADVGLPRAFAKRVLCHDRRRFNSCSLR